MSAPMCKIKYVVADSGAFLRNVSLQSIGEVIYSIPEVVNEIRDKETKARLQVLPYEILYKQPSPQAIRLVSEFAKKTGDYRSLSAVDIRVLALTYQLECENVGSGHIKTEPNSNREWTTDSRMLEKATDIAGFYLKNKTNSKSRSASEISTIKSDITMATHPCDPSNSDSSVTEQSERSKTKDSVIDKDTGNLECKTINMLSDSEDFGDEPSDTGDDHTTNVTCKYTTDGQILPTNLLEDDDDDETDDDDDDDAGWITPSNFAEIRGKMGDLNFGKSSNVSVGCLTMDFAMQNVLIQMGLNVIAVDGMLIKKARQYVLRCFTCFKICTNVMKLFCSHCGNQTLQKVSMTIEEDGHIHYFLSRRKPICTRGMKYSIPKPQGGKHANNPILFEDQPVPRQHTSRKSQQKLNILDSDYIAGSSPFTINDTTSRAAQLGIHGRAGGAVWNKRNPNAVRRKQGRRK